MLMRFAEGQWTIVNAPKSATCCTCSGVVRWAGRPGENVRNSSRLLRNPLTNPAVPLLSPPVGVISGTLGVLGDSIDREEFRDIFTRLGQPGNHAGCKAAFNFGRHDRRTGPRQSA